MKAIQPNKMAATRGMQSIRKTMPMTTLRLFIIVEGFRRHDSNTFRQKTHFYRTGVSLCRGGLKDGERKPATGGWRASEYRSYFSVVRAYDSSTGASTNDAAGTMLPSSFSRAMFSTCSGFFSLSSRMARRQAGESGARRTIYST